MIFIYSLICFRVLHNYQQPPLEALAACTGRTSNLAESTMSCYTKYVLCQVTQQAQTPCSSLLSILVNSLSSRHQPSLSNSNPTNPPGSKNLAKAQHALWVRCGIGRCGSFTAHWPNVFCGYYRLISALHPSLSVTQDVSKIQGNRAPFMFDSCRQCERWVEKEMEWIWTHGTRQLYRLSTLSWTLLRRSTRFSPLYKLQVRRLLCGEEKSFQFIDLML